MLSTTRAASSGLRAFAGLRPLTAGAGCRRVPPWLPPQLACSCAPLRAFSSGEVSQDTLSVWLQWDDWYAHAVGFDSEQRDTLVEEHRRLPQVCATSATTFVQELQVLWPLQH